MKRQIDKPAQRIKGELFVGKSELGYTRLYFQPENGQLMVLADFNGGGYYSDVYFDKNEEVKE